MLVFQGPQRIEGKRSTVRERKRKRWREGGMFVVGNPLKRGNTSVHTQSHTHRCKNIESRETSERIKTCFV